MIPITTTKRMEYIDSITFSENSQQTLPTNGGLIPNDRFIHSLLLEFRGRLTMPASGGPTAVLGDGHAAIIERVTVEGYHRIRKAQEKIIDLRGADLELASRFYLPTRLTYLPSALSVTASATNDILVQVLVPFTPLRVAPAQAASYLLDAPNYESLKLTVQWADFKNLVVAGSTAPTWSAYASASGLPTLRVYGSFAMQANRFAGLIPGRVFRWFQEVTGSTPTTTATQARILDVPRGYDIRSVLLKTGTKATGTSTGNNAYSALSDFLTDLRFNVGLGKYIRRWMDGYANYADLATQWNLPDRIAGLNLIDFVSNGDLRESLNTRPMISGPSGNVDVYISADVAGSANQAVVAAFEELRYRPVAAR